MDRRKFIANGLMSGLCVYTGINPLADPAGGVFVEDKIINDSIKDLDKDFFLGVLGIPKVNGYETIAHELNFNYLTDKNELTGSFSWAIRVKQSNYHLEKDDVKRCFGVSTEKLTAFYIEKGSGRKALTLYNVAWYDHEPLVYRNPSFNGLNTRGYISKFKVIGFDSERPRIKVERKWVKTSWAF